MTTYDVMRDEINSSVITKSSSYCSAGFWMRFWAHIIDILIVTSIQGILIQSLLPIDVREMNVFNLWTISIILATIIYYAYFVC